MSRAARSSSARARRQQRPARSARSPAARTRPTPVQAGGAGGGGRGTPRRPDRRRARRRRRASRSRAATTRSRCRASAGAVEPARGPRAAASCASTTTPTTSTPRVIKEFGREEGVSVRVTTFQTLEEAFSKLSTGGLEFDVIFSTPDQLSRLVGRRLRPAAQPRPGPQPHEHRLARAASPFYDVDSRYTVPYVDLHDRHRLAQRHSIDIDPTRCRRLGRASGRRSATAAASASSTTRARRSAWRCCAAASPTSTPRTRPDRRAPAPTCTSSRPRRAREGRDLRVRDAAGRAHSCSHQVWSGDLINAVISYLPRGRSPTRSVLLVPARRRARLQRHHHGRRRRRASR